MNDKLVRSCTFVGFCAYRYNTKIFAFRCTARVSCTSLKLRFVNGMFVMGSMSKFREGGEGGEGLPSVPAISQLDEPKLVIFAVIHLAASLSNYFWDCC